MSYSKLSGEGMMAMISRCVRRLTRATLCVLSTTLVLVSQGCTSPTRPSLSVAGARPLGPAAGAQISYYSQPVIISLARGAATGGVATTTTVEVATDATLATIVRTELATLDGNGQLTVLLDQLSPATTYYWRAKTNVGDSAVLSAVTSFTIGSQLAIQPPIPVQPLSGAITHKRPILTVANASRSGPSVTPLYQFAIASDAGFSNVVVSGTVPEGPNQTSFTPASDLTSGATFYWRARATNASPSAVSVYSSVQSFTTVNPDDGLFRYNLTLRLASAMKCNSVIAYKPPPDVAFDSGLVITGDHLRYTVQQDVDTVVQLDVDRSGNQLSGTLRASGVTWPGIMHIGVFINAAVTSGTLDTGARLTGIARGYYSDEGFPGYIECLDSEIAFTLTPHP